MLVQSDFSVITEFFFEKVGIVEIGGACSFSSPLNWTVLQSLWRLYWFGIKHIASVAKKPGNTSQLCHLYLQEKSMESHVHIIHIYSSWQFVVSN